MNEMSDTARSSGPASWSPRLPAELVWLKSPARGLLNPTLVCFFVVLVTLALSTVAALVQLQPLAMGAVLNTVALYALYTVHHEAVHGLVHPYRPLNNAVGRVAGLLEGIPFPLFRVLHLQHHAHTNHPERDPDWVLGRRPRWLLPLWLVVRMAGDNGFMVKRRLWRRKVSWLVEHAATLALQGALAGTAVFLGNGRDLLLLWVVPVLVSATVIYLTVGWLVHFPHSSTRPLDASRNLPGRLLRWVTFGQSLHLVHHLWPRIPWYRYGHAEQRAQSAVRAHRGTASEKSVDTGLAYRQ